MNAFPFGRRQRVGQPRTADCRERGFTLIELLVVLLIVAILIAIGVPTFLAAKRRAQDRVPQASLKLTLTQARGVADDSYSGTTPAVLQAAEPSLGFVPGTDSSPFPERVSVAVLTTDVLDDTLVVASYSRSGKCFYVRDVSLPASSPSSMGTTYASKPSDGSDCTAADLTGLTFAQSW